MRRGSPEAPIAMAAAKPARIAVTIGLLRERDRAVSRKAIRPASWQPVGQPLESVEQPRRARAETQRAQDRAPPRAGYSPGPLPASGIVAPNTRHRGRQADGEESQSERPPRRRLGRTAESASSTGTRATVRAGSTAAMHRGEEADRRSAQRDRRRRSRAGDSGAASARRATARCRGHPEARRRRHRRRRQCPGWLASATTVPASCSRCRAVAARRPSSRWRRRMLTANAADAMSEASTSASAPRTRIEPLGQSSPNAGGPT